MKFLDKLGLVTFSVIVLLLSIMMCILVFGWIDLNTINLIVKDMLNNEVSSNIILGFSIVFILLAIKCIFFTSDVKEINGVKDGILLKNDDGQLVISKTTLEELVNNIVRGFDSAQNPVTRIILDKEHNLIVNVVFNVKETAVIKELSANLQNKIKSTIKSTSDLDVKEVNISVKELQKEVEQKVNITKEI